MMTPRINLSKSPYLAFDSPGDRIRWQLQGSVPKCMTSDHLIISGAMYMFFGEHHYEGCIEEKEHFGKILLEMARLKQIKLYVEEISRRKSELPKAAGIEINENPDPNSSILNKLNHQPSNTVSYFVSRPEELHSFGCSGFMVEPVRIVQLMELIQQSLDLRISFVSEYISIVMNIAGDILNQSLLAAQRMQRDGLISQKLSHTIENKLIQTLRGMLDKANNDHWKRAILPIINNLRRTNPFMDVIEDCVFAPHIVSDAVFATKLYGEKDADPQKVPIVIVSGIAHAKTLKTLLSVLDTTE